MKKIELDIIKKLNEYGITDKLEIATFLGQCAHESGDFKRLGENLNYSVESLLKMFPHRFTKEQAQQYGRSIKHPANQQMIANIIYGSRLGNENNGANDNDGWNYRGGGLIQLTGKANYLAFMNWLHQRGKNLNLTIDTIPDFVRTQDGAILSAIWFWLSRNIGKYAINNDIVGVTKKINGGTIGLDERKHLVAKYKKELGI